MHEDNHRMPMRDMVGRLMVAPSTVSRRNSKPSSVREATGSLHGAASSAHAVGRAGLCAKTDGGRERV